MVVLRNGKTHTSSTDFSFSSTSCYHDLCRARVYHGDIVRIIVRCPNQLLWLSCCVCWSCWWADIYHPRHTLRQPRGRVGGSSCDASCCTTVELELLIKYLCAAIWRLRFAACCYSNRWFQYSGFSLCKDYCVCYVLTAEPRGCKPLRHNLLILGNRKDAAGDRLCRASLNRDLRAPCPHHLRSPGLRNPFSTLVLMLGVALGPTSTGRSVDLNICFNRVMPRHVHAQRPAEPEVREHAWKRTALPDLPSENCCRLFTVTKA
jgi:hypothetical protein